MAEEPIKRKRGNPAFAKKKGEPGYLENRTTEAAHKAAAEVTSIFPTVEEFQRAADGYFNDCDDCGVLYGEAGLALYLSEHNRKQAAVTLTTLRRWYDGERCPHLQDAVQMAYLRIQNEIETSAVYREKGMVTRGIFLQKQSRLGGYQDRIEQKNDTTVRILHGESVDESDFK